MSCGTCPASAQPTTRADGMAPTPGQLLWSKDVGAWYRRQRAQGLRPEINLPAAPAAAPAPRRRFSRYELPTTPEQAAPLIKAGIAELTGHDFSVTARPGHPALPPQVYIEPPPGRAGVAFSSAELQSLWEICGDGFPASVKDAGVCSVRLDNLAMPAAPGGKANLTWSEVAQRISSIQAARNLLAAAKADPLYALLASSGETALYTTRTGDTPATYEVTLAIHPADDTRLLHLDLDTTGELQLNPLDYREASTAQAALTMRRAERAGQGLVHCLACGYIVPDSRWKLCPHCRAPKRETFFAAAIPTPTAPGGTP